MQPHYVHTHPHTHFAAPITVQVIRPGSSQGLRVTPHQRKSLQLQNSIVHSLSSMPQSPNNTSVRPHSVSPTAIPYQSSFVPTTPAQTNTHTQTQLHRITSSIPSQQPFVPSVSRTVTSAVPNEYYAMQNSSFVQTLPMAIAQTPRYSEAPSSTMHNHTETQSLATPVLSMNGGYPTMQSSPVRMVYASPSISSYTRLDYRHASPMSPAVNNAQKIANEADNSNILPQAKDAVENECNQSLTSLESRTSYSSMSPQRLQRLEELKKKKARESEENSQRSKEITELLKQSEQLRTRVLQRNVQALEKIANESKSYPKAHSPTYLQKPASLSSIMDLRKQRALNGEVGQSSDFVQIGDSKTVD